MWTSSRQDVDLTSLPITPDSVISFKEELDQLLDKHNILDFEYSNGTLFIRELNKQP